MSNPLDRTSFGYVVAIESGIIRLNLHETHRGRTIATPEGPVPVLQVGAHFGIRHGQAILVARVESLEFVDAVKAHLEQVGTTVAGDQPLRQIKARAVGSLAEHAGLQFQVGGLLTPDLGATAIPLTAQEAAKVVSKGDDYPIVIGSERVSGQQVEVDLDRLLGRHVAVVGGTGQGKSCLTAAFLQRLRKEFPGHKCVIFDINGEYHRSFRNDSGKGELLKGVKVTRIGSPEDAGSEDDESSNNNWYRIPYPAFGKQGLEALLTPSQQAQRPALRFALDALPYVKWTGDGVGLANSDTATLFDDCRKEGVARAKQTLSTLRKLIPNSEAGEFRTDCWPCFQALAPLVAERVAVQQGSKGLERSSFHYGHVSPLIRRIQTLSEDIGYARAIDFNPSDKIPSEGDNPLAVAQRELLTKLFGFGTSSDKDEAWKLHIIDLRLAPHDLLPYLLSGILSALLEELFRKGPGNTDPLLLVLEEAHHYIRRYHKGENNEYADDMLPYERLAKEGRKFGVSIWLSTQRPSELSPTVLAQCGTWFCLRLTSQTDRDRIRYASEWSDRRALDLIAMLPRQEAVAFGAALPVPVHIRVPDAKPETDSFDPPFGERWKNPGNPRS